MCTKLASLSLFVALASTASAHETVYRVCLDGSQEVPPVATSGVGTVMITFTEETGEIMVTGSYSGLTGIETAAHIHGPATIGGTAGPILTLTGTGGTSGTVSGSGTLTLQQSDDLVNGLCYINVHTTSFMDGEIRGQIVQLEDISCPPQLPGDPIVADSAGTLGFGPKIGSATEPFNLTIDCTGASQAGVFAFEMRTGKLGLAVSTKFGYLRLTGTKLLSKIGNHSMSLESWFPTAATLPADPSLAGRNFHVQGYCGGYVPNGRTSNSLTQTIGL